MRRQILLTATAAALLSLSVPVRAFAQDDDPEVTAMAKQHYKLGLDAYTAGKYDLAIKELKKAYLLKRLPPILLNIGLTYRKTKDYDMAVYFYKKYLAEAPPDDKQRPSAESAIGEIEAEKAAAAAQSQAQQQGTKPAVEAAPARPKAQPAVPAGAAPAPGSAASPAVPAAPGGTASAPAPGAPITEWSHTPIDAVPPGKPIDVRVQMPVMKGVKVKAFFRKEGQATFDSLELKRRGNEKVARLPPTVAEGRTFQYYVEARDAAGTLVKSAGSEASPNIVLIDPSARPQVAGAEAEGPDDEELAARPKKGFSRDIENESASLDGDQKRAMARLREQMSQEERRGDKKPSLGLLGKVGVGLMAGGGAALGGGIGLLVTAQQWGELVSQDWECQTKVRPNGSPQCPHFGGNETMPKYALDPPTSTYDSQGRLFNDVGLGLTVAGGVVLAAGTALLATDIIKRRAAEHAASQPKAKPGKKRKVKKVIEVEEEATSFNLSPVISPTTLGIVGELRF